MRAVVLDYDTRELREREIAEPRLATPDDVLLRIAEVGICGTDRDLALFRFGYPPEGERYLVLGHEALARVEAVGESVEDLGPGDWVVPTVRRPCQPPCPSCARGRRDLCTTGAFRERGIFGHHGFFSELALDRAEDLVRVPEAILGSAVLLEPLSIVEKAVETALRLHAGGAGRALVLGAGPIGILAALVLRLRGLAVELHSNEPEDHPRVGLLAAGGIEYRTRLEPESADLIIEATGSPDTPVAALEALARAGVLVLLGTPTTRGPVPFRELILKNQVIAGSVNASRQHFAAAAVDLARMPQRLREGLIRRCAFSEFQRTVLGPPQPAPKLVHVIADNLH